MLFYVTQPKPQIKLYIQISSIRFDVTRFAQESLAGCVACYIHKDKKCDTDTVLWMHTMNYHFTLPLHDWLMRKSRETLRYFS